MNRKQFLSGCFAGACGCAATTLIPAASLKAAEPAEEKKQNEKLEFVQTRYAALLGILAQRMNEKELDASLADLGSFCASDGREIIKSYRGNFDGFVKFMERSGSGDTMTWDQEKNVVRMVSPERKDCFCPLNSRKHKTPGTVCNCSLGWQRFTWETFFARKVDVQIKESVLRGGKRCVFEIHVGTQPA